MFQIKTRIKWVRASLDVSNKKDKGIWKTCRGVWKAFWKAPRLDEVSSIEEFKTYAIERFD